MNNSKGLLYTLIGIIAVLAVCIVVLVITLTSSKKNNDIETSASISSSQPVSSSQASSSKPEQNSEISSSSEPSSSASQSSSSSSIKPVEQPYIIAKSGEYVEDKTYSSVLVKADNIIIKNMTVKGNLTVDVADSTGFIDMNNMKVGGKILITNGSQSFTMENVIANELKINTSDFGVPSIEIRGTTHFNKTYVFSNVLLREYNLTDNNNGFTHIGIGGFDEISDYHDIYLQNIKNSYLTVNYPANIKLLGSTRIKEAYAYKPCHFYDKGSIDYLYCLSDNISYNNVNVKVIETKNYKATKGGKPLGTVSTTKLNAPIINDVPIIEKNTVAFAFNNVKNANAYTVVTYKNNKEIKRETIDDTNKELYLYFADDYSYKSGDYIFFKVQALSNDDSIANSDWTTSYSVTIA